MEKEKLLKQKKEYENLYNECWYKLSEIDRDSNYNLAMDLQIQKMYYDIQIKEIDKQLEELGDKK